MKKQGLNGKRSYIMMGIEDGTQAAIPEIVDFYNDPDRHVIVKVDDPQKLWQGVRERHLDMIIEVKNDDAEEWFLNLFTRNYYRCEEATKDN